jgi:hypothetical protein
MTRIGYHRRGNPVVIVTSHMRLYSIGKIAITIGRVIEESIPWAAIYRLEMYKRATDSHVARSNMSLKVKGLLKTAVVGVALAVSWVGADIAVSVLVNAFKHTLVFA